MKHQMSKISHLISVKKLALGAALSACSLGVGAADVDFKVKLDSTHLLMGRTMNMTLTITQSTDKAGEVVVPFDSIPLIEFCQKDSLPQLAVSTTGGANKKVLTAEYKIQAFDSGDYRIPPLAYIYNNDTVFSNGVSLKVIPVDVSEMDDINPIEGPGRYESKWYDFLPDWLTDYWLIYVLSLLAIGIGIVAYLILSKKVTVNILPKRPERPAYEVAMEKLTHLRSQNLWEQGNEKAFYTELTDILREYLDRRFHINAMEMTSTQIVNALNSNAETQLSKQLMEEVLKVADYVKFAKEQPAREENIKSFDMAVKFVDDTKPLPPAPTEQPKADKK